MEINFGTNINTNSYPLDDIIVLDDLITPVELCGSETFQTCLHTQMSFHLRQR